MHNQFVMENIELEYSMTDDRVNHITDVEGMKLILSKCMSYNN